MRIFTLYLLRDPRASLADIKVNEGGAWFDLTFVTFPRALFVFLGVGKVQGEGWRSCQGVWKQQLQNGASAIIIIGSEALCND